MRSGFPSLASGTPSRNNSGHPSASSSAMASRGLTPTLGAIARQLLVLTPVLLIALDSPLHGQRKIIGGSDSAQTSQLPFSPAVQAGNFVYLSGALGLPAEGPPGDAVSQTGRALDQLDSLLDRAGLDRGRVVDIEIFVVDLRDAAAVRDKVRQRLGQGPALTLAQADLALVGAKVEVAFTAAIGQIKLQAIQGDNGLHGMLAGDTLFLSGATAPGPQDAGHQTRAALERIGGLLDKAGMSPADLVACRVDLADSRDYGAMNEAYGPYLPVPRPVRATVRAASADKDAAVQIRCQAVRDDGRQQVSPPGVTTTRPFSPALSSGGRLFLSGMVGRGSDGYPAGVEAQTRIALQRLQAGLKAAGLDFDDVHRATVWLTDVRHYGAMNKVYREMVGSPAPARATVGNVLMSPDALVEIQMEASLPAGPNKAAGGSR